MPNCAWRCEPREFGLGQHDGRGAQGGDRRRPSGAENDGDVVLADPGALADDLCRPAREFAGIWRHVIHTAGA
jgi:hypothetical protein